MPPVIKRHCSHVATKQFIGKAIDKICQKIDGAVTHYKVVLSESTEIEQDIKLRQAQLLSTTDMTFSWLSAIDKVNQARDNLTALYLKLGDLTIAKYNAPDESELPHYDEDPDGIGSTGTYEEPVIETPSYDRFLEDIAHRG